MCVRGKVEVGKVFTGVVLVINAIFLGDGVPNPPDCGLGCLRHSFGVGRSAVTSAGWIPVFAGEVLAAILVLAAVFTGELFVSEVGEIAI